jgi:heavy metal sensor kinase
MLNSVRWRLTLWYVAVFGLLLVAYSIAIYLFLHDRVYKRVDLAILQAARLASNEFTTELIEKNNNSKNAAIETLKEMQAPNMFIAIFQKNQLLASNFPQEWEFQVSPQLLSKHSVAFHSVAGFSEEGARIGILPFKNGDQNFFVVVVEPLHELIEQLESIRRLLYCGFAGTILIAGIGGFLLAKKSLASVIEMSEQAKRISAANLQERLKVLNPKDELGRLAAVFNELLSRLDESFEKMKSFMADASHELRTPLSIIRGEADVTLSKDRDSKEYKESLIVIQEEAVRLSRIVEDLMSLARADAGQLPLRFGEFYINDVLEEVYRAMKVLADSKRIFLQLDQTEEISIRADEDLIQRLVMNLLDNAIKYSYPGDTVVVRLAGSGDNVNIVVSDNGIGIPAESIPYVFERFYRDDKTRSPQAGSGLGLAIAKWIVEAHRGSIHIVSKPGHGSNFIVRLPKL